MRIGVMGLKDGHIGEIFRLAATSPEMEMVGIVEPDDEAFEKRTQGMDIPRFPTLDDMISEAKPELIVEGLHHAAKTELVEKAAEAGIHLILDKPLCTSLDDWERMKRSVDKSGIKISMWFTSRSYGPFVRLREHIMEGHLGQLVSFISTHPHKLGTSRPDWYFDPSIYTGTFHDVACHGVDFIRWISGQEYTGVHALATTVREHPGPLEDHVQASFSMTGGAAALLTADWLTPHNSPSFGDTRMIIMGTKGSAHLRAYAGDHLLVVSDVAGVIEPEVTDVPPRPFISQMIEAIEKGEEHFISTDDVFTVARACLLAQQSAKLGGAFIPIN